MRSLRTSPRLAAAILLSGALAACASQGLIQGRLAQRDQPSAPTTPVTLAYRSNGLGNGGTLSVQLPDGELYTGRYLQITSAATIDTFGWGGFGPYWADWGPWGPGPWAGGADWTSFANNYSGAVVATLFGDRGHTMRCRFHLASPTGGMRSGGVGECQTSDGQQIEAQF